ncbi:hypothetical protein AsAng_0047780 [Aureispira anguillae]|uniref:Uncharacterized protein n=1 Tax=Aureispira anguillae TaxID=2864201 RepID=A0A915YIU9_9BACT|nr:hypothetical protein AsAng_0047780 [Aureispira anguillae]
MFFFIFLGGYIPFADYSIKLPMKMLVKINKKK